MIQTKHLVVLGVGNEIRMDDGAGIRVVERLERDSSLEHLNISFKYLNTGGFDILDEIDGYKRAIIVDAASMTDQGLKPGEFFYISDLSEYSTGHLIGVSSHGIGVLQILRYAKVGGYRVPHQIEVYGIQVKETGYFSEKLTPEVAEGVENLVNILRERILKVFSDYNEG
ncbi:MAG: hydrogenase maturation protease [Promethearchaeota archaeon]